MGVVLREESLGKNSGCSLQDSLIHMPAMPKFIREIYV